MSYLVKTSFLLLIVVPVFFLSCEKERALLNPHDSKTDPDSWSPSNLKIEQLEIKKVKLTWKDNTDGEDGYRIDRKKGDNNWKIVVGEVGKDVKEWIDTNHSFDESNKYQVYGFAGNNTSSKEPGNITPLIPAPSNVTVKQDPLDKITLTWKDNSVGEDGFKIDRRVGNEDWVTGYGTVSGNETSWSESVDLQQIIDNPIVYNYGVYTYVSYGASSERKSEKQVVSIAPKPPNAPSEIDIVSVEYNLEEMTVTWEPLSESDSLSYHLFYSETEGGEKEILQEITDRTSTAFTVTDFNPTHENWYWVTVTDYWGREYIGQGKSNDLEAPPTEIDVLSVVYTLEQMSVSWEDSPDDDFVSYELLHAYFEEGEKSSVVVVTDKSTTLHTITEFDPTHENWYWVQATDYWGQTTTGNGMTHTPDSPPTSVNVTSVSYDATSMVVNWSESEDDDFASYEVLHSSSESGDKTSVSTITEKATTSYVLTEFDPTHENWFWIRVTDYWGLTMTGNGITHTPDSSPSSVNIQSVTYDKTEMVVTWSESGDDDFVSYEVLYSSSESGDKTSLSTITDKSTTSYVLTEFDPTHENWFWIKVTDYWGLSSLGSGKTSEVNASPQASEINPIKFTNNSFLIRWEQNFDSDFYSYTLYQSSSEDMSDKTDIFATTDQNDIDHTVTGVQNDERRYYQLLVKDTWGSETTSSVVAGSSYLKIAFNSTRDGDPEIYIMDSDGQLVKKLTNNSINDYRPIFSPDGSKILFQRQGYQIWAIDLDDGSETQLASEAKLWNEPFHPTSGEFLYTQSYDTPTGSSDYWEIYSMNIDGSTQQQLTYTIRSDIYPIFSPDGQSIFYVYYDTEDGRSDIWSMSRSGSDKTNLTNKTDYFRNIQPSPDGSKIICSYRRYNNYDYQIAILDNDGSDLTSLTEDGPNYDPQYSPDGSKIVFYSYRDSDYEIYLMDSDGSNETNLTNRVSRDDYPEFSPDGSKILFNSERDGNGEIYIMDIDGSNLTNLSNDSGTDYHAVFQPVRR